MAYGIRTRASGYRRGGRRSVPRATYTPRRAPARRRTYRRKAVRRSSRFSRGDASVRRPMDAGEKFAALQMDPFEVQNFGGKIPDSNTVPSVAVSNSELFPITLTTGTNTKCYAYFPSVTWAQATATEGVTSWSWPATFGGATNFSKRTDYGTTYELDRPVAHGIRITSGVAPTDASGFVHIAIAYESWLGESTWAFPSTPQGLSSYQWYKRVSLASLTQTPITICNKYIDETAFRYRSAIAQPVDNAGQTNFHTGGGWGAILIAVEGGSAGILNPCNIEWIYHSECVPKSTGVASGSPAAPFNPTVMSGTSNMVANTDLTHTEINQASYVQQARQMFAQGAGQASSDIFSNYVAPAISRAGYAAVSGGAYLASRQFGIGGVNNNPNRLALN